MSNLIPISELPSEVDSFIHEAPEPKVVWNVDLPSHVDQDRIMLDVGHMRRLQKLSGSALTAVNIDPDAKSEEYDANIAGINMNGTAMMGRAKKVTPADPSQKRLAFEFEPRNIHDNYGAFIEGHFLNKSAMVDEVVAKRAKGNVSSEDAWGRVLDDHLQASLRQSAREVLIGAENRSKFSRNWEYGWLAMVTGIVANDVMTHSAVGAAIQIGVVAGNYGLNLLTDSMINRSYTGESLIEKKRWSLFMQSQPDRYLAFNALTRVNSLIKVRK